MYILQQITKYLKYMSFVTTKNYIVAERILSFLIILIVAIYGFLFFQVMATTSLWNDEIYTIVNFISQGPLVSVTDYSQPNNHIFFSLLNALTPNAESYNPSRARLWSFIFMFGTALIATVYFFRQKMVLEGSIFLFAIYNSALLDLTLQARGYGLLFFCMTMTVFLHIEFIRTQRLSYFLLIALLTILGAWTIPLYIFIAGPLMLLTFLYIRQREVFLIGFFTVLIIVALYLPVLEQLLKHAANYADVWGKQYASISSVATTLKTYLLRGATTWFAFVFLITALVGSYFIYRKQKIAVSLQILSLSTVIFFMICLLMETPIIRTTSFIIAPIVILSLFLFSFFYHNTNNLYLRLIILMVVSLSILFSGYNRVKTFNFIPIENWMAVAEFIENTVPEDIEVYSNFRTGQLRIYLDKNHRFVDKFDREKFLAGQQLVVDSNLRPSKHGRFNPNTLPIASANLKFPQRRAGGQYIWFRPREMQNNIKQILIDHQTPAGQEMLDGLDATRWTTQKPQRRLNKPVLLQVLLDSTKKYRSITLISRNGDLPVNFVAKMKLGETSIIVDKKNIYRQDDVLVLALGNRPIEAIELTVFPAETDRFFSVNEIWATALK